MSAWQDRNGSLAGQIWELGRTEKKILAVDDLENTTFCQFFYNFYIFSAIFGCFLPHIPVFPPFLLVFQPFICHFCQFAEQIGRVAWHRSLAEQNWGTWPPLTGEIFGRKGLNFGRTEWLAPPWKWPSYAYDTPLPELLSNEIPTTHTQLLLSAGDNVYPRFIRTNVFSSGEGIRRLGSQLMSDGWSGGNNVEIADTTQSGHQHQHMHSNRGGESVFKKGLLGL